MPQTSPMSWMMISLLPIMMLMMMFKNNKKNNSKKTSNNINKTIMKKWTW